MSATVSKRADPDLSPGGSVVIPGPVLPLVVHARDPSEGCEGLSIGRGSVPSGTDGAGSAPIRSSSERLASPTSRSPPQRAEIVEPGRTSHRTGIGQTDPFGRCTRQLGDAR